MLIGNKSLWKKIAEEQKKERKNRELRNISIGNMQFETQKLQYDTSTGKLKNPHIYVQTIHLSDQDFNRKQPSVTKIESGNTPENASESQ